MKKYIALVGLAAFALPACTNQNGYNHGYQGQNGQYQDSQYPSQDGRSYSDKGDMGDSHADHKGWKDAKLEAMVDHFFDKADTNKDGTISWKEFEAYMHKKFREADKNHDGMLTRDEVMAMKRHELKEIHEEMHGNAMHSDNMRSDGMNSDGMRSNENETVSANGMNSSTTYDNNTNSGSNYTNR